MQESSNTSTTGYIPVYLSASTTYIKQSRIYTASTFDWSGLMNGVMLDEFAQHYYTELFSRPIKNCLIEYSGAGYSNYFDRYDGIINNHMFEVKIRYDIDSVAYGDCMGEEDKRLHIIASASTMNCIPFIMFIYTDGFAYIFDLSSEIRMRKKWTWVPKNSFSKEWVYKEMVYYDKRDAVIKFRIKDYLLITDKFKHAKNKYKR